MYDLEVPLRSEHVRLQSRTQQSKDRAGHIQERIYQSCLRVYKQFSNCDTYLPKNTSDISFTFF